ncbi:MAG TPA: hypothetical protein VFS00_01545 [Polyangiaceae bacterium]|nr:hypothetical protein [Polyangiaceae bacterium]
MLLAPLSFVGVALAVLVFASLLAPSRRRRAPPGTGRAAAALAQAATALGASGGGDLVRDGAFQLSVGGRRLHVFGARPRKGHNVFVGLGADGAGGSPLRGAGGRPLDALPRIALRPETAFERFGKRVGLNLEVETGDAAFDRQVYVDSEAPRDDVAAVLADERVRRGVMALLDAGCAEVAFAEGSHAVAALWPAHLRAPLSPDSLQDAARHLLSIAEALPPKLPSGAGTPGLRAGGLELAYFLLGIAALVIGSISNAIWTPVGRGMATLAAGLALLTMASLLAFGAAKLKGRSDALPRLCVAAVGASMLGPGFAVAALNVANGCFDSTSVEHPTDLVAAYHGAGRSRDHYVKVAPWEGGGRPYEIKVSRSQFDAVRNAPRVLVRVGSGRLGYPWVRSVEPL